MAALVAIEPALHRRANDEGHDRGDKQGSAKYFQNSECRRETFPAKGRRRKIARQRPTCEPQPMTLLARNRIEDVSS